MARDKSKPERQRASGDCSDTDAAKERETGPSRQEAVDQLLDKTQAHLLSDGAAKGTFADYMRLLQVRREFTEESPREIEIKWVNVLGKEDVNEQ